MEIYFPILILFLIEFVDIYFKNNKLLEKKNLTNLIISSYVVLFILFAAESIRHLYIFNFKMKKFVLTFLIFTIGLEVLVRTTTVPWIFEPSFSQIGSLRSVEKEIVEANSTKIVFLGNSLTRDAVSPLIVSDSLNLNKKEVLNLGLSAGNYFIDEYLIKSFNVKPEIIFLQVDIGRFEYDQIEDTYYFIKYSKLNDWNTISKYWYSPDNF